MSLNVSNYAFQIQVAIKAKTEILVQERYISPQTNIYPLFYVSYSVFRSPRCVNVGEIMGVPRVAERDADKPIPTEDDPFVRNISVNDLRYS